MRGSRFKSINRRRAPDPAGSDTDADFVAAARLDTQLFGALYERYRDDLLRYTFYCLGDWEDAADATQQTFTNAMAGLPGFVDRGDSFRPWLFRIAHNEVCNRHGQRARRATMPLPEEHEIVDTAPTPEELALIADEHQRLRTLLQHLSSDRRQVCELRFAGLTDKEIARVLGKSEGAVRTTQSRAVAQLRGLMGVGLARAENHDA